MCFASVYAQNVEFKSSNFPNDKPRFKKAMSDYRKGMKYFEMGPNYFSEALEYYLKAEEFNPNDAKLNYQIGVVYNVLKSEKALTYMERAVTLDSQYQVHAGYTLAEAYHLNKQWDKAISMYQTYIRMLEEKRKTLKKSEQVLIDIDVEAAKLRIMQCENGKKHSETIIPVLVTNVGDKVNSKYPDYAPVTSAGQNTLIFTTRREGVTGKKYSPYDVFPYEDIYYTTRNEDGSWNDAKVLPGKVNTRKHEASVWLSQDGKKLIVYKYKCKGDLFQSSFDGESWSKPKRMPHINSKHRETHASMTEDGKTIYFTSDNPKLNKAGLKDHGGERLDIYKITLIDEEKKKWSKPESLGSVINTPYDEACVYISPDGKTLYFSSEGHTSIGGLDIFRSQMVDGAWSQPENIGFPVNSTANDIFVTVSNDQSSFFMDSDRRTGLGEKDIYEVINLTAIQVPLAIKVYDSNTRELVNAKVELQQQGKSEEIPLENTQTGEFSTKLPSFKKYDLVVTAEGYNDYTTTFNTNITDPNNIGVTQDIYLQPAGFFVLKGRVLDNVTREKVPATIEVLETGATEKSNTVGKGTDEFETELAAGKEYKITIMADGYTPYVETIVLDKPLDKDFLIGRLGTGIALNNIYFDFDKSTLRPESIKELRNLKEMLERSPDTRVEISGHTDNIGTETYNEGLSMRRARAVVNWLVKEGLSNKKLSAKGFGEGRPVATNGTAEGRQLNRRVEFKITQNVKP